MPGGMNYSDNISSSDISDSPYVFQSGELSLSNLGQLELLLAMVESGVALRMMARGTSMRPFIRDKDVLTISPVKNKQLSLGDVVAFTQPGIGKLAIHRIIGRTDKGWLIRGDNCPEADGVVATENIIGRVYRIERQGKEVHLGIGKAAKLIAILNRGNALLRLKKLLVLLRRVANYG